MPTEINGKSIRPLADGAGDEQHLMDGLSAHPRKPTQINPIALKMPNEMECAAPLVKFSTRVIPGGGAVWGSSSEPNVRARHARGQTRFAEERGAHAGSFGDGCPDTLRSSAVRFMMGYRGG